MALLATAMMASATDYTGSLFKTVDGTVTEAKNVKVSVESGKLTFSGIDGHADITFAGVTTSTVGKVTFYTGYNDYGFLKAEVRADAKNADSPITVAFCQIPGNGKTEFYRFGNERYTIGQLLGSDFEKFHTVKNGSHSSEEPDGWHSFMSSVTGALTGSVKNKVFTSVSDDVRPGAKGTSVKLVSHAILGIPANGTLTTGRLYAKSTNKTDASQNNSTSDPTSTDTDAAGDPFYAPFSITPDSVAVWVKFKQGSLSEANKQYKYATINAVLTDGTKYQDPEDKTYTNVIGSAQCNTIESNGFQWQRIVVPFTYKASDASPKAMLVTLSTNAQPGVGSTDDSNPDELYIDDLRMIYDTHLATVKFDGAQIDGFSPEKTEYTLKYKGNLDIKRFTLTPRGHVMGLGTDFVEQQGKTVLYVTVVGADAQTTTVYTINLVKDEPQVTYTDDLNISLNGEPMGPEQATIVTTQHEDGTYDLMLKQFSFSGMLIGDVTISNVEATTENGYTTYRADKDARITEGAEIAEALGGKVHVKLFGQSHDGKLYAEISLPVALDEDDVINVDAVFGKKEYTGISTVNADTTAKRIYNLNGMQLQQLQRGVNIIVGSDGKAVKVLKK